MARHRKEAAGTQAPQLAFSRMHAAMVLSIAAHGAFSDDTIAENSLRSRGVKALVSMPGRVRSVAMGAATGFAAAPSAGCCPLHVAPREPMRARKTIRKTPWAAMREAFTR